jgi:hypothetical protein
MNTNGHYFYKASFYESASSARGAIVVARYQVSAADPNVADPTSAQIVLIQPQPGGDHNGGVLTASARQRELRFADHRSLGDQA